MGRRRHWAVDGLESREHLSVTPILGLLGPTIVSTRALAGGGATAGDVSTSNIVPITADESAPLPNEVSRRRFHATFSGRVQEEPPRLIDQARQFYVLAVGNTNQFLHGTIQIRYYTPRIGSFVTTSTTDPTTGASVTTQTPAVNTTGTFSIADRSTQSGGLILADLIGSPTQEDARGRPTQFVFSVNGGGGSGGIYASSTGTGTLRISYRGNVARVVVDASIFIYGISQPLDTFQSNTHH